MRRQRQLFIALLILSFSWNAYSQRKGAIIFDSLYTQGYINYSAENLGADSVGFTTLSRGEFTYYFPEQIKEYSLNGKVFHSKRIGNTQQFLNLLAAGSTNLYQTKQDRLKKYYLQTGNEIQELHKDNYSNTLKQLVGDNQRLNERVDLVHYKQNSLSRFIISSNDSTRTFYPYRRAGIILGNSSQYLKFNYRGFTPKLHDYLGIVIGGFIDMPIEVFTKWSLRIEAAFISHSFSLTEINPYIRRDYTINLNAINLPVLVRYRFYGAKLIPFFELGAAIGFNYKNNIGLVETINDQGVFTTKNYNLSIIDKSELGLVTSVGLDYQLSYDKTLGITLRYQFNFGMQGRIDHTIHDLQLLLSYSF